MAWTNATFENVLDDLSSRFIINVPDEELASVERICFQIEQAHWFYEDFIREQNTALPSFNLKNFSAKFFQHCPLLHEWANEHETAFANFMEYKIRVPVCGAIILNEAMDKCLLVKGWTARSGWGFPKGKINKDEPDTSCAVREVWEETGFDVTEKIKDEDYVEQTIKDQRIRLYIIKGVTESTVFEPQTRKEISKIEWHYIAELPLSKPKAVEKGTQSGKESGTERANGLKNPSRYYMVTPFVYKLKNWISNQKRNMKRNRGQHGHTTQHHHTQAAENQVAASSPRRQPQPQQQQQQSPGTDSEVLKSMLGIGKGPQSMQDLAPYQQYISPVQETRSNSDSLKALLGIQNSASTNTFTRDGMATGSPTLHSLPASYNQSRPVSSPAPSSSTSSYQHGSDALKVMLGIPTQSNSSLLNTNQVANGASSVSSMAGMVPNNQGPVSWRPQFSPQVHHSSTSGSPVPTRNGSVDLLALLKGGSTGAGENSNNAGFFSNGNGHGSELNGRHSNPGFDQSGMANGGAPVKSKSMQNFAFDVDALF
ncbi:mRNA-decapping enzyme subunit 2 [Dissophora globulifera]|uniref:mRNA-decapping enzyme subunit 2 n=1 Tax=Dissophora globulifera TaxID=979702 RepID=A0A9P6RSJ1_9FUNG|nr:mRNA-decapping enzyme subunit 2 [Dissophora globulifera]